MSTDYENDKIEWNNACQLCLISNLSPPFGYRLFGGQKKLVDGFKKKEENLHEDKLAYGRNKLYFTRTTFFVLIGLY